MALWEKKLAAVTDAGGTCFSCQDDFHFCSLVSHHFTVRCGGSQYVSVQDIISRLLLGHSFDLLPGGLAQMATLKPKVDQHGGATFDLKKNSLTTHFLRLMDYTGTNFVPGAITYVQRMLLFLWPPFLISYVIFRRHLNR